MISLQGLSKIYNEKQIIDNMDYKINRGDFIYIIGKSGNGKSTLLYLISQLEKPTSGQIIYDEKIKKGFLFQNYALLNNKTVLQNIQLTKKYPMADIEKLLMEFELSKSLLNRKVFTLSGGEQQRVSLIRQILGEPEIIFADEPTGNLDADNEQIIINKLKQLNKTGVTIIIATHNTSLIIDERVIEL